MTHRAAVWANEMLLECLVHETRLWQGGAKKDYLHMVVAMPMPSRQWGTVEAVAFGDQAEEIYNLVQSSKDKKWIIRGRFNGSTYQDGKAKAPQILIHEFYRASKAKIQRQIDRGEIETYLDAKDRQLAKELARDRYIRKRTAKVEAMAARLMRWALDHGGLEALSED